MRCLGFMGFSWVFAETHKIFNDINGLSGKMILGKNRKNHEVFNDINGLTLLGPVLWVSGGGGLGGPGRGRMGSWRTELS